LEFEHPVMVPVTSAAHAAMVKPIRNAVSFMDAPFS
jgi:hypothetical protein